MKVAGKLLLFLVLGLAACAPVESAPVQTEHPLPDTGAVPDLASTSWQLVSLGLVGVVIPVPSEPPITLEFGMDGHVGGHSGCNSYGGPYTVQDGTLQLGEIVSTLIACDDQAVSQQEEQYLQALGSAGSYALAGDTLTIWYEGESSVLDFVRAAASTPTAPAETPAAAQPAERVELTPGAGPVQRTSLLPSGFGVVQYVLAVSTGQTLAIEVTSDGVPLSLTIRTPGGVERFPETSPVEGGGYWTSHNFTIDEAGDYLVTLTKADHTASTNYTVNFTIR